MKYEELCSYPRCGRLKRIFLNWLRLRLSVNTLSTSWLIYTKNWIEPADSEFLDKRSPTTVINLDGQIADLLVSRYQTRTGLVRGRRTGKQ